MWVRVCVGVGACACVEEEAGGGGSGWRRKRVEEEAGGGGSGWRRKRVVCNDSPFNDSPSKTSFPHRSPRQWGEGLKKGS